MFFRNRKDKVRKKTFSERNKKSRQEEDNIQQEREKKRGKKKERTRKDLKKINVTTLPIL